MRFPLKKYPKIWCKYQILEVEANEVIVQMTFITGNHILFTKEVRIPRIGNGSFYEDMFYIANDVYSEHKDDPSLS